MRVLAVNQFYAPDMSATSQLLTQLCEDLVALGDEVTVVASRGGYLGGSTLSARAQIRGVDVVRPWATGFGKKSVAHRLADYLSFWTSAVSRVALEKKPDVVLALTTPPMIAAGVGAVARVRRVPLVAWVQDVYPDVAVAFGMLRHEHPATAGLRAVARATHRLAARSVALSQGMAERLVDQGAAPERVAVIHNWADGQVIRPVAHADNAFRHAHALEGRFVVMYSGNLGVGHDVASLVAAARLLEQSHPSVVWMFVGEGGRLSEAKSLAAGLSNVRFVPYQPYERLVESLSAADVHLASLKDGLEGLLVPSKLYGVLAAGRPLFYLGPGMCEISRVVRENKIGWQGRPGDAPGLAAAVARAAQDPIGTAEQGARARKLLEERYDRRLAVARWRALLAEAARGGR